MVQIIMHTLPTAYAYGTSYWPFYSKDGKNLCLCSNYALCCPHVYDLNEFVRYKRFTPKNDNLVTALHPSDIFYPRVSIHKYMRVCVYVRACSHTKYYVLYIDLY